jgi:hypothetical protein
VGKLRERERELAAVEVLLLEALIWLESLPGDFKSELVQARERGQVRVASGTSRPSAI